MNKTAVIYARHSTNLQQSIPAQISALRDWLFNRDITIIKEFSDEQSGKNIYRQGFQSLKNFITHNQVDMIAVWRFDRIARNLKDLSVFLQYCEQLNVEVISVSEPSSNGNALDKFQISILGAFAEYQQKVTYENQQIAYKQKHDEGKIVGSQVPYGYHFINEGLTIYPPEAKIVKRIFSDYALGYGFNVIAKRLNKEQLFNRNQKAWMTARIKQILENEFYIGKIKSKYGEGNTHHLPIIEEDLFNKVQNIRKEKGHYKEHVMRRFVLRKKIFCPFCNTICTPTHSVDTYYKRTYFYYSCSRYTSNGKYSCQGVNVNASNVEKEVAKVVSDFLKSDNVSTQIKRQLQQKNTNIRKQNKQQKKHIKKQQLKILEQFEKGNITEEKMYENLTTVKQRNSDVEPYPLIPQSIVDVLDYNMEIDTNPTIEQFIFYQSIVEKIEVDEQKKLKTVYLVDMPYNLLDLEESNGK